MRSTDTTLSRFPSTLLELPGKLLGALLVAITGVVLGQQYVNPNRRVLPVLVGLVVTGLAWRVGMLAGLGVLVLALPFPRGTIFGNTNLALILLLLVIWLLRVSQRQSPLPHRSPVDVPIVGLLIMYMLSFYNVRGDFFMVRGLQNFELFVGTVLMFYLIINNVRTNQDLERLHHFMLISAASIFLVALYELNHPAAVFIRGWIDFTATIGTEFNTRNVRVGSMFHDYELLSEYCAITLLLGMFVFLRARTPGRRLIYTLFLLLNVFIMFTTVTRGAIVALAMGLVYLLWIVRRHIKFVPFVIVSVATVVGFLTMNFYVAHFTRSGDMIKRFMETRIVQGWMPDTRAETWHNAWGRALAHPILGSGPSFADIPGWHFWWPHNVYLYYANIIGFTGLLFFLWLLGRCLYLTRTPTDDLRDPDYARAYLIICRIQIVVFMINEFKIDYLRNNIYLFPVWVMIAVWVATAMVARSNAAAAALPAPARAAGS